MNKCDYCCHYDYYFYPKKGIIDYCMHKGINIKDLSGCECFKGSVFEEWEGLQ